MKRCKWGIVLIVACVSITLTSCFKKIEDSGTPVQVCDYQFNETNVINSGWTKVFEENFDSDFSQWNIWEGGAYNDELQHYQSSNASISNGILIIEAKKETVTGKVNPYTSNTKTFNFTSARLESKATFSASVATPKLRFVARIKLPSGKGMWPAFWTYGANWPTNGEIDIMEAKGSEPFKYATNYFYGSQVGVNQVFGVETKISTTSSLTDCYHVYEGIWEQSKLTFYLDGVVVDQKTGGYISSMFGKTQWITLNAAVGGHYFTNLNTADIQPGTMYIDWVKVYKSN